MIKKQTTPEKHYGVWCDRRDFVRLETRAAILRDKALQALLSEPNHSFDCGCSSGDQILRLVPFALPRTKWHSNPVKMIRRFRVTDPHSPDCIFCRKYDTQKAWSTYLFSPPRRSIPLEQRRSNPVGGPNHLGSGPSTDSSFEHLAYVLLSESNLALQGQTSEQQVAPQYAAWFAAILRQTQSEIFSSGETLAQHLARKNLCLQLHRLRTDVRLLPDTGHPLLLRLEELSDRTGLKIVELSAVQWANARASLLIGNNRWKTGPYLALVVRDLSSSETWLRLFPIWERSGRMLPVDSDGERKLLDLFFDEKDGAVFRPMGGDDLARWCTAKGEKAIAEKLRGSAHRPDFVRCLRGGRLQWHEVAGADSISAKYETGLRAKHKAATEAGFEWCEWLWERNQLTRKIRSAGNSESKAA